MFKVQKSMFVVLPAAFGYAGNQSFICGFAKADPAQTEFSHEPVLAAAFQTAAYDARFEFRGSF
jgi:hypothetical protein